MSAQQLGVGASQSALALVPGIMSTLAGTGVSGSSGDGSLASAAKVTNGIRGIAADAYGDVFFVDDTNGTIRVVYEGGPGAAQLITAENPAISTPQIGSIYVVAGIEGSTGTPANGTLATSAKLKPGAGLALDAAGDVYFNDTGTGKVWVVYAGGTGTTGTNLIALETGVTAPVLGALYAIAGNSSTSGYVGNGVLATSTGVQFHGVNDMKFDVSGNMYIVDQGSCAIRVVSASNGFLTTIAGTGTCAVASNNGPAISTALSQPYGVAVDASGNIYIADKGSVNAIRMVYEGGAAAAALITLENPSIGTPTVGNLYAVAGGGSGSYPYGGLATSAKLKAPTMVALDAAGNIYIADNSLNTIDEVNPLTGALVVVAGNGTAVYSGDGGSAVSAGMVGIRCVAVDAAGRIYITDATDLRIREVSQGIVVFPGQAAGTTSAPQTIQLSNTGNATLSFTAGAPVLGGANASDFSVATSSSSNTCNLSPLAPGASCVLALTYSPSGSGSSSATLSFTTDGIISPQTITLQGQVLPSTTTSLQISAPSVVVNTPVTLTAKVTGTASPAGSVTFASQSATLGTVTLSSGVASLSYTPSATGDLTVSATYQGNSNNAASTSSAVSLKVTGSATSTTTLSSSASTVTQGQSLMISATIVGSGSTPTGNVVFTDGSTTLATVALNGAGVAAFTATALPVGPNTVQALYLGDSTYASSSSTLSVQVYGVPAVALAVSSSVINQGLSETLTAKVSGNGVTPTGSVTFYDGATALGTASLSSGTATYTTTSLSGGANSLTAAYSGDSNYNAQTSAAASVTVNVPYVAFTHPGGWLSSTDITRIRAAVANQTQPYYAAYLALPASPNATYTPSPSAVVTAGTVNSGSLSSLQSDENNAWILATKWVATGDQTYATALCGVIDGWSAVLTAMNGNNGSLRAGIYGGKLAESAEICAYANPSWPNKVRAQKMFRQAFAQDIHDFSDNNVPNGNWETSCLHGMMSIAIFLDDRDLFRRALTYYLFGQGNGAVNHYVINAAGQSQESGRDQGHTLDGLNHLAETAQDAWHQGIDLYGAYGNQLLAAYEYLGGYLLGGTPAFVPNRDAWNDPLNSYYTLSSSAGLLAQSSDWDMIYNHYVVLQGMSAPNTTGVVASSGFRPETPTSPQNAQDFVYAATLLFTRSAGLADPVTSTPVSPVILSSQGTGSGIVINWVGSVGASSYNVYRSGASGGPYTVIASVPGESTNSYTDGSASGQGTPYFYIVTAVNSFGESAAGAEARASAGLPAPWSNQDLGTLGLAGTGGSDYLGASSFTLRASGSVVGNSNSSIYYNASNTAYSPSAHAVTPLTDSLQFAYVSMTGDGTLVARVNAPLTPVASSAGLMIRDSLATDAAMMANMVEYTGLAVGTSRASDGATAVSTGPVTISAAATAPADESSLLVAPYWVRLVRSGDTFTASVSPDNVTWSQVSTQTIAMPATVYAGLALASGNSTLPATATFDEVSLPGWNPGATVPAAPANLTAVAQKGITLTWSTVAGATSYTVQRGGATIATLPAPLSGLYASPAGTMSFADYTATAGSSYAYTVSATGAGGTGAASAAATATAPALTAPYLSDSVSVPYVTGTVGQPLTYQVGLAGVGTFGASGLPGGLSINPSSGLISGTPSQSGTFTTTITATNAVGVDSWAYTFTIASGALPAGMQQADIGFLEAPGIAGISGSNIVNVGTGNGIGAVCDNFHFAYYQLTGDGSIVVNLNSVSTASATTTLSQTGIMMRNTLTCDSLMIDNHAGIGGSTTLGSVSRTASNTGGLDYLDAGSTSGSSVSLPQYLQISRAGNTFTASSSPDGVTWTQVTSKTIAMNPTIYVGLDASPQDDSPTNTSTGTYNNLSITSTTSPIINSPSSANGQVGVPFSFTVTSAIFPAVYSATGLPAGLTLNASTGVISGTPTTAGTYAVTVGMANGVASGNASLTIVIGQAAASVSLSNLAQMYDGSAKTVTAVTNPAGLSVSSTYNGSTAAPVAAGSYSVVATIQDANYAGTSSATLVIQQAAPAVSWPAPAAIVYGTPLSATQLDASANVGGTFTYTPAAGTVLPVGVQTISVTFTPSDLIDYTIATQTVSLTVNQATSSVTLIANPNPAAQGKSETLSATVTGAGQPTGTVVFTSGSTTLCTATLNSSGVAVCTFVPSASGVLSLSAQYQGDANHLASATSLSLSVYDQAITQQFSSTQLVYPGATNLTACVTGATSSVPTGTIQVFDGTTQIATLSLQGNGCAYWYISPGLSAGTHPITSVYSGDSHNPAGSSSPVNLTVSPVPVNLSVSCWNASFPYGGNYQCTVNVSSNAGAPSGAMTYSLDGASAVSVPLSYGNASISIAKPSVGSHTLVVSYAQQTNYAAATPQTETFTVASAPVQVSLSPSTWYTSKGTSVSFQATVTSYSAGPPNQNGAVSFYLGSTLLGTVPVDATGHASYTTSTLPTGSQTITASYAGGANYASGSTSVTIQIVP